MTWWLHDPEGWLIGQADTEQPGAVPVPPPGAPVAEATPGELWPRWFRYGWSLDVYPTPPAAAVAYAFDGDGWFTGEVPVGSVNSLRVRPDLLSTTTTPGEPRARLVAGSWVVQAYAVPRRRVTKRAFWGRFPAANETAMRAVMASGQPLLVAAGLLRLNARVESSPWVDLDLDETQDGIAWVASTQVPETVTVDGQTLPLRLAPAEASQILNAPISPDERP